MFKFPEKKHKIIPENPQLSEKIRFIALFGLFLSISTQMLYSHLALFLKFCCGASDSQIASVDGFVEFLSYFIRIFSGAVSDYLHDRKLLLLIGCFVAIVIKPIFAFTSSVVTVIFSEIAERLGSGIQASPRDALIADLSEKNKLGTSFGFCKSLKTIGGIAGSAIALGIIYISGNNYRLLFILSAIPALIALGFILKIKVSRAKPSSGIKKFDNPFQKKYLKSLDKNFWEIMAVAFICEIGHFGESLLTLRSAQFFSQTLAGMTSVFAAIGQVFFTYFMGIASDRISKIFLLKLNLILIAIVYSIMAVKASGFVFLFGVSVLCGQYAVIQLLFLSIINLHVSPNLRGTAIGVFYCTIGIAYMLSAEICGFLCDNSGYNAAFSYALTISCAAFLTVHLIKNKSAK